LIKAVTEGCVTKVQKYIKGGGSVFLPYLDFSLYHIAARYGHADIIKALSVSGADINTPDKNGATPLSIAIRYEWSCRCNQSSDCFRG